MLNLKYLAFGLFIDEGLRRNIWIGIAGFFVLCLFMTLFLAREKNKNLTLIIAFWIFLVVTMLIGAFLLLPLLV
jgi:hypothetical protein